MRLKNWIWFGAVVAADQLSKQLALKKNFSTLRLNSGLPFGLDLPGFFDFWIVLGLLVLFVLLVFKSPRPLPAAVFLIFGGAVSNLWDRAMDGTAVDFIKFWNLTTINMADIFIVTGIFVLIFGDFRKYAT